MTQSFVVECYGMNANSQLTQGLKATGFGMTEITLRKLSITPCGAIWARAVTDGDYPDALAALANELPSRHPVSIDGGERLSGLHCLGDSTWFSRLLLQGGRRRGYGSDYRNFARLLLSHVEFQSDGEGLRKDSARCTVEGNNPTARYFSASRRL